MQKTTENTSKLASSHAKLMQSSEIGMIGLGVMGRNLLLNMADTRPIFEALAARDKDKPCVAWLGAGSAGHFVKMVHNGIEYGLMQLLAETYDLMKRGMGMNDHELLQAYASCNEGELNGNKHKLRIIS